ncbi:MAG: hypothetical protein K9K79_10845 [Desulfohalobiaceae bacterium]|nr:hypothetical protein [Desulfohalobiaceae bacterium]
MQEVPSIKETLFVLFENFTDIANNHFMLAILTMTGLIFYILGRLSK